MAVPVIFPKPGQQVIGAIAGILHLRPIIALRAAAASAALRYGTVKQRSLISVFIGVVSPILPACE